MKTMIKNYGWVIGIILLFWLCTFGLYVGDLCNSGSSRFGEMFGALNTLFSGLAFAFVIIALLQQQKQFEKQQEQSDQQAFEATFFKLLEIFRSNLHSLQASSGKDKIIHGKLVMGSLKAWLEQNLNHITPESDGKFPDAFVREVTEDFYKKHEHKLGDYFRILFHLLQHIRDAKCLTKSKKQHFANLVRAVLDKNETFLLVFNGISDSGKGSQRLISEFDMIKHRELGHFESLINLEHFYTHLRTGE